MARFSSTAVIIAARDESMPLTARRGEPLAGEPISACTSPINGRLPSSVTVTAVPDTGLGRWSRKSPDGSATHSIPLSCNRKQPTSSAAPKRFFTPRTIRSADVRSPSKCSTTSTRCSSERGPAMAPSFVTWPTRSIATPDVLAAMVSAVVTARTWVTPPVTPSASVVDMVCTESITTRRRPHLVDVAERRLQIRFGGQVDLVVGAAGAFGPQPDLAGRLLARQIQRAPAGLRPAMRDLEQQRRLADARIACEQRHRAWDQTSAENTVQFTDPGVEMPGVAGVDRADRHRGRGRRDRAPRGEPLTAASTATSSTVPQVPQSGQRPTHLAVTWWHSEQRYCERAFATP